jgi:hypothetical protein
MESSRRDKEAEGRLQKILQGAFAGPPTSLKHIPTESGNAYGLIISDRFYWGQNQGREQCLEC